MKKDFVIIYLALFIIFTMTQNALSIDKFNHAQSKLLYSAADSENYYDLSKRGNPFVIMFSVDWCGACKMLAPYFNQIKSAKSGEIKLIKVNAESEASLAKKFGVRYYPTFILFNPQNNQAVELSQQAFRSVSSFNQQIPAALASIKAKLKAEKTAGPTVIPGNMEQSIKNLNSAIIKEPKNAALYYFLADIYFRKNQYDMALSNFHKVLSIQPNNEGTLSAMMRLYLLKNDYDKTIEFAHKLIRVNPTHMDAYGVIGFCNYEQGELDKAIENFNKCIEVSPNNKNCRMGLSMVYAANKQVDLAISAAEQWKDRDYNNSYVYTTLGTIYFFYKKDTSKAKDYFIKALSRDNTNSDAYALLAGIYFKDGDVQKTLENLKLSFNQDSENPLAHCLLGGVYKLKGQDSLAQENFRKAQDTDPFLASCIKEVMNIIRTKCGPLQDITTPDETVKTNTPDDKDKQDRENSEEMILPEDSGGAGEGSEKLIIDKVIIPDAD